MYKYKNTFTIGGLEDIGYAPGTDILLVLSSQGEGLFDCTEGRKLARRSNDFDWWKRYNSQNSSIEGFDILQGIIIKTSGLIAGDNLVKKMNDYELVSVAEHDDKPFEEYTVNKIYLNKGNTGEIVFITKDGPCEIRAFGFSETGNSFAIALSCEIIIYSRL